MSYELDGWDYHAYQMKVDRTRDKHATISKFELNKQEIAKHEEYLEQNKNNIKQTFVPKTMSFMDTWQYIRALQFIHTHAPDKLLDAKRTANERARAPKPPKNKNYQWTK